MKPTWGLVAALDEVSGWVFVVTAVLCALLGAFVGHTARGQAGLGFWLGLLFGPLGCVGVLFAKRSRPWHKPGWKPDTLPDGVSRPETIGGWDTEPR